MPKVRTRVRTRVSTVTCNGCGEEIFSCARHDFRSCKCGKLHIDGGFDYVKVGFHPEIGYTQRIRYVPQTRKELFDDWNLSLRNPRKYGSFSPPIPEKDALSKKRPSKKDKRGHWLAEDMAAYGHGKDE